MSPSSRPPLLGALLLLFAAGCSTISTSTSAIRPPPPSEALRARMRSIAVVSFDRALATNLSAATSGRLQGARAGAGAMVVNPLEAQQFGIAYVLMLPVLMLGGAIVGSIIAAPAAEVDAAEAAIRAAFDPVAVSASLRRAVCAETERAAGLPAADLGAVAERPAGGTAIAAGDADTVVVLSLAHAGLLGDGVDPPLTVRLAVEVCVLRAVDGAELHAFALEHRGGATELRRWSADAAAPFAAELERACEDLADELVNELFLLALTPDEAQWRW